METRFSIKWDRPIHLHLPDLQIDHGGENLPGVASKEEALAILQGRNDWLLKNGCSNIRLYEDDSQHVVKICEFRPCEEGPPHVIETPISPHLKEEKMAEKQTKPAPELYFSKKDIEGCYDAETVYIIIISTPIGIRHERLYPKMNNDQSAHEAFDAWLGRDENSIYKKAEFRQYVMVHKQTRILISTRIA